MVEHSVVVEEVINSSVLGSVSLEGFVSFDNDLATSVACGTVFHKSTIIVHHHDDYKMQSYVPACTTSSVLPFFEQEVSLVNFSPDVLAHCYKKFEL